MRFLLIAMFVGMISAGYKFGGSHTAAGAGGSTALEERLQMVADRMNAAGPKALGGGMILTNTRAEGRIIHLTITGAPDWRDENVSDEEMKGLISAEMCGSGNTKMLSDGGMIKVHLQTPGGGWLPDLLIDRCPTSTL